MKFTADGRTVASHSKNDAFGRKVFDELQFGTGFASRQFSYHVGQVTETHAEGDRLKSSPTTQLVERIILSDGRKLSYEYDKEERITKVTGSVEDVTEYTYDAQGNPTNYFGYELTWEKGRQLKSFEQNTYTYNANGIRTSKTVNGVTHTYILDGTNILRETWGDNELVPMYDNEDNVCGIIYNDSPFYFLKNLQGDVIAIIDKAGKTVAGYSYDAWGVCTIKSDTSGCNIAMINPYRYRSYYYDTEIGMYYLQSRYYDPSVGRFVNGDSVSYINASCSGISCNLYTYCENNIINASDESGKVALFVTMAIGAVFGMAIQWFVDILTNIVKGVKNIFKRIATNWDYICSALSGAATATGIGKMGAMFVSVIINSVNYIMNCITKKAKYKRLELILNFIIGLIFGFIGGSGANLKRVNGVVNRSQNILKTAILPQKNCHVYCQNQKIYYKYRSKCYSFFDFCHCKQIKFCV